MGLFVFDFAPRQFQIERNLAADNATRSADRCVRNFRVARRWGGISLIVSGRLPRRGLLARNNFPFARHPPSGKTLTTYSIQITWTSRSTLTAKSCQAFLSGSANCAQNSPPGDEIDRSEERRVGKEWRSRSAP